MTTPSHYLLPDAPQDLIDLWIGRYGLDTTAHHLEMCGLEYCYRARKKGSYQADMAKVRALITRLEAMDQGHHAAVLRYALALVEQAPLWEGEN